MLRRIKVSRITIFAIMVFISITGRLIEAPFINLNTYFIPVKLRGWYFFLCLVLVFLIGGLFYGYYKKHSKIPVETPKLSYLSFIIGLYILDTLQTYIFYYFIPHLVFGDKMVNLGEFVFQIPKLPFGQYPGIWLLLVKYLSYTVAAPLFEEILFRGILPQVVLENYSNKVKIIVSSLLFATLHLGSYENIFQWLAFFNSGLLLYAAYSMRKSLLDSIVLHSMMNSVQWILLFDLPRRLFF